MYYDSNLATMTNKCTSSASRFDGHGSAPERYRRHCPMQHVQGYSGSHWTPPSGNYLLPIAPINKYTYKAGCFDGHGDAPVRNHVHCLMEEVQGFTRSHWTLPSGGYFVQ